MLKSGGCFISITFSQPHFRGPLLYVPDKYTWNVHHYQFGTDFHYYFYVASKKTEKLEVLCAQEFDYDYSCLCSAKDNNQGDSFLELSEDEDYLLKIGDICSYNG